MDLILTVVIDLVVLELVKILVPLVKVVMILQDKWFRHSNRT